MGDDREPSAAANAMVWFFSMSRTTLTAALLKWSNRT
jgi:hypothetical protein